MNTIQEYFENKSLEYHCAGKKNVTRGWINIKCPFCGDHSWHCGINLTSGLFHCWLCGSKGDVINIIKKIEGGYNVAKRIRKEIVFDREYTEQNMASAFNMPKFIDRTPLKAHIDYLKARKFDPDRVIEKYNLYFGQTVGRYRLSIIIPVFSKGKPVCFVAADCTGESKAKYLNSPNTINVMKHTECLYNLNDNQNKILIVEGIFDAWRTNGVALLTKRISATQITKLCGKDIVIWLDPGTIRDAEKIASMIWWCVPKIIISDKEPDESNLSEIKEALI